MENDKLTWDVINAYFTEFKDTHLVKHMLDGFNDFALRKLEQVIEGFNPIQTYHQYVPEADAFRHVLSIDVSNPVLSRPTIFEKDGSTKVMTPHDARVRNFSYAGQLHVDLTITARTLNADTGEYNSEVKRIAHIPIGRLPIMVRSRYCVLSEPVFAAGSSECAHDYGGYFIINGNEKVVISQDRIAENKTFVFLSTKVTTYSHIAEVRSVADDRFGVPKTTSVKLSAKPNQHGRYIKTTMHHIKHDIPLFVLFRALGLESDKDIVEAILGGPVADPSLRLMAEALVGSVDDASGVADCQRDALEYLSRYLNANGQPREYMANRQYRLDVLRGVIERDLLPHVGPSLEAKALYLASMVNKLLRCFLGIIPLDDRDSYVNKRVDTPGVLLGNLFRQYYGKLVKDVRNMLQKEVASGSWRASNRLSNVIGKGNINKAFKSTIIESGLKYGLATGNWGVKSKKTKQGVAQVLNRMTYAAMLSHLRRINTPIEKSGKIIQPRKLHATQWGVVCPCECFDPKTPILTWDGTVKEAKDIAVGDRLIDDAGNAVRVKSTCKGFKSMYEVVPDKDNFMSYTVTDNHVLTLKVKKFNTINDLNAFRSSLDDDNVIDITIEKYLSLPTSVKNNLYVFKSAGINWEEKAVALDPYILGMWLGDGMSDGYGFATADKELLDKWIEWGADNNATIKKGTGYKYSISSTQPGLNCNKTEQAPLKKLLAKYGLVQNKHIPRDYLVNDRKTRLAVLAGLVDTDGSVRANGHEIRITQGEKNYRILYDAEFLARSLGFSCHVSEGMCTYAVKGEKKQKRQKRQKPYKELTITGFKLYEIPTVLPRKKLAKFNDAVMEKRCDALLLSSFKLVEKDVQPFVGWQVEGSGRFLLADMSVTHNTPEGAAVGLVKNLALMAGITVASSAAPVREHALAAGVVASNAPADFEAPRTRVLVNGAVLGYHQHPAKLTAELRRLKHSGVLHPHTSIVWDVQGREVILCTEGGRCVRPLFVVDGSSNQTVVDGGMAERVRRGEMHWADVVMSGAVEYLDVEEANRAMIAMKAADLAAPGAPAYTHLEMHPSLILGVLAGSIPFSDHNQAPRNTYQCLWLEEPVLMGDGTRKKIKDVRVGDQVVTFNPNTMVTSVTSVVNQYVRPTDKRIYQVTTCSGRTIRATHDHKFMTNKGWMALEDFGDDTLLGIHPSHSNMAELETELGTGVVVLDTESFMAKLREYGVSELLAEKHLAELSGVGLIPLTSSSTALQVLARMSGFLLTDSSVNVYDEAHGGWTCQLSFGTLEDALKFEDDVARLGLNPTTPLEGTQVHNGAIYHTFTIRHSGAYASLMATLGLNMGNPIPNWIMRGSMLVKREFLAAFQGGNGCTIRWTGCNFVCGATTQSTHPDHAAAVKAFMEQLKSLFNEFGVETNGVALSAVEGDGDEQRVHVAMKICDTHENLISYMDRIGYRYSRHKFIRSAQVVEYLKHKSRARPAFADGECVVALLKRMPMFGDMVFVPIESVEEVPNCLIADITVASDHHAFIGGDGFAVHNSAMGKQAIGLYATNYQERYDTVGHVLNYPQRPLVQTRTARIVNTNEMPCGVNVMVAIATYTGYNQEDSVIMNRSAIERGLFNSTVYKTVRDQNSKNHSTGEEEFYCCPDAGTVRQLKPYNYNKLDDSGFVPENTLVESGDIVVGKCMPQKVGTAIVNKDTSVALKGGERCFVDRNAALNRHFINVNGDGYTFAKVRTRADRVPTIGDKCSCYTADHDVLTANRGWVPVAEVTKDDQVATLVEGALVYQKPTAVQAYEYQGPLYNVESNQVSLMVTPNHRMYICPHGSKGGMGFRVELAEKLLGRRVHYKKGADTWQPQRADPVTCPELVYTDDNSGAAPTHFCVPGVDGEPMDLVLEIDPWLKMFGVWMAEGCAPKSNLGALFAAHKPRVQAALEECCHLMQLRSTHFSDGTIDEYGEKHVNIWRLCDKRLFYYFNALNVGAVNKALPNWVWYLSREQCRTLISGMMLGDGHTMANGTRRYDTSSTVLADQFQRLCLHAGYACNKLLKYAATMRDGYVIKSTADAWRLTIIEKQLEPEVNKNKNEPGKQHDRMVDSRDVPRHDGKVYCCTVPAGEGVIYVRREGLVAYCGQSRHGQKGTIGMIYPQCDLPFTKDGLVPDLIVNPHAIPSRMTIAQLMECIMGKACAALGTWGDATPFTDVSVEDLAKALESAGLERYGNEVMYDPRSGYQMETAIFVGPTFYQRLKHMVCDKVHCVTGDHDVLTERGWVPIPNVTCQDRVATLQEGKLVYVEPIEALHFPNYKGKMYCIQNQAVDLNVTYEHRMLVAHAHGLPYRLEKACNIVGKTVHYKKDAEWAAGEYQFVLPAVDRHEGRALDMDAWLTLFGAWMADGEVHVVGKARTPTYNVIVRPTKAVLIDAVMSIGLRCQDDSTNTSLVIQNKQLYMYLATLESNKRMPQWVWQLSQGQARKLLLAMCNTPHFTTLSAGLADDFQRLCLHAGWSASAEYGLNGPAAWRLSIIKEGGKVPAVSSEVVYQWEGPVFCLRVPGEVFYVRRNGKACWTGNSRAANGPVVMMTRQPAEGRARDGGLRLGEMEIECNWAHGSMQFLKERIMECSDNYRLFICRSCGMPATAANPERNIWSCRECQNSTSFAEVRIPYAAKLLFQEVQAMGIAARFRT